MTIRVSRRGFSLLEITMVLMVVGIVTSAIWVAAQHVLINYRVARVNEQVMKIVQNMRDTFGTTAYYMPYANAGEITSGLDALLPNVEIFPAEMRRDPTLPPGSTVIDHALNNSLSTGSMHVFAVGSSNKITTFSLHLTGLNTSTCIQLLMSEPMTNDSVGFLNVATVGGTGYTAAISKGISAGVLPMTPTTAATWCTGATEVDFDFGIHN